MGPACALESTKPGFRISDLQCGNSLPPGPLPPPSPGSIGVVTINMPRLGWLAEDEAEFLDRLDRLMLLVSASLETKRKVLEHFTAQDLYPHTKFCLRDVHARFGRYWENRFSTIGLVGMNEACLNLLGCDIRSERGRTFAGRVLHHMRDRLTEFQQTTGHLYNLEATPAEGTSYRLARIDSGRYPGAATANPAGGEPFYSNSTQLPVNYSGDVFQALDLQDELPTRYTGGTVYHVFLGEAVPDPLTVARFVCTVCHSYKLPYFTLTPSFSICPRHGYLTGETSPCPTCDEETEVYSLVVGHLRPVKQWNAGKQAEFPLRRSYTIDGVR
jgi:ribonucleoside-triphosphate reductase